jgi:hypothetical protein
MRFLKQLILFTLLGIFAAILELSIVGGLLYLRDQDKHKDIAMLYNCCPDIEYHIRIGGEKK